MSPAAGRRLSDGSFVGVVRNCSGVLHVSDKQLVPAIFEGEARKVATGLDQARLSAGQLAGRPDGLWTIALKCGPDKSYVGGERGIGRPETQGLVSLCQGLY